MRSEYDIRAEINGTNNRSSVPDKKTRSKKKVRTETKTRQPRASDTYSILAQAWCDHAASVGFDLPYDVNYFALALEKRVARDKVIQKFLAQDRDEQVQRWLRKMVDLWWSPIDADDRGGYVTNEVTAKNAKDYFLGEDWEDLRDYARSCLRAAYLVQHGRRVPPPIYPNQQEYQERLRDLRKRHTINNWLSEQEGQPDPEPRRVDEAGRERLRSFAEKRRKK